MIGILSDISERRRAEQEARRLQTEAIAELSTPLIPIIEDILVMPLIRTIDQSRAHLALDTRLAGIVERRASFVILDITGVRSVNADVADVLIRMAGLRSSWARG